MSTSVPNPPISSEGRPSDPALTLDTELPPDAQAALRRLAQLPCIRALLRDGSTPIEPAAANNQSILRESPTQPSLGAGRRDAGAQF